MLSPTKIVQTFKNLRSQRITKNRYMEEVRDLREGRWEKVFPEMLPEDFPRPFVANYIDIAAKDTSEVIAPLPSFNCESDKATSERARKFADTRTRIANYYVDCSNLATQMYSAADRLLTYGYVAFLVQPDLEAQMPKILADDTFKSYYVQNPYGNETLVYAVAFRRSVNELALEYPDSAKQLIGLRRRDEYDREVCVIRWSDKQQEALVVEEAGILLRRFDNPLGKCMVRVVEMPKLGDCVRGQYDDAVGVQVARTLAQKYAMEAMRESVQAPIEVPEGVQQLAFGPGSILRVPDTATRQVRRVDLNVPPGVFAESQNLTAEARLASRYPEGRSGQIDASIITGQGVEALMGTFSTQIATAQKLLAHGLRDVIALCFEMDEKLFPNVRKSVTFKANGSRQSVTYTPAADIRGDYSVDVTYGMAAGLDPNRALVLILQSLTAGVISQRTAMEELPFDINVEEEKAQIDIEQQQNALVQAMAGYAQAIPMMATQGMDPAQAVAQIAEVVRQRKKGRAIEEAVAEVFAPPPPPQNTQAPAPTDENAPPTGQPSDVFNQQTGLPPGIAQGQAQYGAGGARDLLMALTGMTPSGDPNLSMTTSKRVPV